MSEEREVIEDGLNQNKTGQWIPDEEANRQIENGQVVGTVVSRTA